MDKKEYKIIICACGSGDFILVCHDDIISGTLEYVKEVSFDSNVFDLKEMTLLEILRGIATECVSGVFVLDSEEDLNNFIDESYDVLNSVGTWGEFLDLFEG